MNKKRVLIICTGNWPRSQMAEALLLHEADDLYEICSAGTHPAAVRPEAVTVMREISVDIFAQRSKPISTFQGQQFDFIITVCDKAREEPRSFRRVRAAPLAIRRPGQLHRGGRRTSPRLSKIA